MSNFWGYESWSFLHNVTFNYPLKPNNQDKINFYKYFKYLGNVLPCNECKRHYKKLFQYIDIKYFLSNRYGLIWWLFIIHNLINKRLNKQLYDFKNLIDRYHIFNQNNNCSNCSTVIDDNKDDINNKILKKYYHLTKELISKYEKKNI